MDTVCCLFYTNGIRLYVLFGTLDCFTQLLILHLGSTCIDRPRAKLLLFPRNVLSSTTTSSDLSVLLLNSPAEDDVCTCMGIFLRFILLGSWKLSSF
jgi:hypothetical protein